LTGQCAITVEYLKDVVSVMHTCGMYDFAGEWTYRIGIPARSGVGGGILAVVPGQSGIGTFSTLLDNKGNSVRGILACQQLSEQFGLHIFDAGPNRRSLAQQLKRHTPAQPWQCSAR
jgi:glutaminase